MALGTLKTYSGWWLRWLIFRLLHTSLRVQILLALKAGNFFHPWNSRNSNLTTFFRLGVFMIRLACWAQRRFPTHRLNSQTYNPASHPWGQGALQIVVLQSAQPKQCSCENGGPGQVRSVPRPHPGVRQPILSLRISWLGWHIEHRKFS